MSARGIVLVAFSLLCTVPARAVWPSARADAAGDGVWQELAPPGRQGASAVYDPIGDRLILLGGAAGQGTFNDVWSFTLAGAGAWNTLVTSGPAPAQIGDDVAFYDPPRARIVLVDPGLSEIHFLSLPGGTWTSMSAPFPEPSAFDGASGSLVYDYFRNRILVFGGASLDVKGSQLIPSNDTWSLDLITGASWTIQTASGGPPPARYGQAAIYDPVGDRMVISGGVSSAGVLLDTWALALSGPSAWSQLYPGGAAPSGPFGVPAIFDAAEDAMLVLDGNAVVRQLALSGQGQWTSLAATGVTPDNLSGEVLVLDESRDHLTLSGGAPNGGNTWSFDIGGAHSWTPLAQTPPARSSTSVVVDPAGDQMLLFGGLRGGAGLGQFFDTNDVWARGLGDTALWRQLAPTGPLPGPRDWNSAMLDSHYRRMVIFGGEDDSRGDPYLGDLWTLSLGGALHWAQWQPAGAAPSPRAGSGAIYDPAGQRMLIFGGANSNGANTPLMLDDTWALSLDANPAWTQFAPAGTPPSPRMLASVLLDSRRGRMIVFGGVNSTSALNDTWALTLDGSPEWSQLNTVGTPSTFGYQSAIYDSALDRIIVYDGQNFGAVWALPLSSDPSAWVLLQPTGIAPTPRVATYGVMDGARHRMVITDGQAGTILETDTWALSWPLDAVTSVELSLVSIDTSPSDVHLIWYAAGALGQPATVERSVAGSSWLAIGEVMANGTGLFTYDDRDVAPGGHYGYRLRLEMSSAPLASSEAWVDVPSVARLALQGAWPNPSHHDPRIAFSLAGNAPARLELFDAAGTCRLVRDVGSLGPGEHVMPLLGLNLAPGIYFARLEQARQLRTARLVVVR